MWVIVSTQQAARVDLYHSPALPVAHAHGGAMPGYCDRRNVSHTVTKRLREPQAAGGFS
jgi:hypothetical protein